MSKRMKRGLAEDMVTIFVFTRYFAIDYLFSHEHDCSSFFFLGLHILCRELGILPRLLLLEADLSMCWKENLLQLST